jgi:dihydrofolate reductase
MRKVKLQMQVSVDGFVAGPGGEPDWLQWNSDAGLLDYVSRITKNVDYILTDQDLENMGWENNESDKKDFVKEINKLKKETGGDIIVCGGSSFVSSLIKEGLIDEYHVFINPTAIGKGKAIFQSIGSKKNLKLVSARPFECGVVLLFYKPE